MHLKKYVGVVSFLVLFAAMCSSVAFPAAAEAAENDTAAAANTAVAAAPAAAGKQAYTYTSAQYGYSIICPQKPVGVIPVSALSEGEKGEVLIFANDGYNIQRAWVILPDAFTDQEIPDNLGQMPEAEQKAFIGRLETKSGYEFVRIADINGTKGIYAVTAKVVEVTGADGKPTATATADTQMIKIFFKGKYGGHFAVELIDNPELTKDGIADYEAGVLTFQEWPTKHLNGQNVKKAPIKQGKKK
jgi:hypothetical protein